MKVAASAQLDIIDKFVHTDCFEFILIILKRAQAKRSHSLIRLYLFKTIQNILRAERCDLKKNELALSLAE